MATDTYNPNTQEAPRRSGWGGCLLGCAIVFGILLLLMAIAAWWVSNNWRGMVSGVAAQGIQAMIDQSELPAEEKVELKTEVTRVTDGFAKGTITDAQMQQIMDGFFGSPLMQLFIFHAVEAKYLNASGLSDDEKAEAKVTLNRFASGLMNKQIDRAAVDRVLPSIADKDANSGEWKLRNSVTDDQLRTFLAAAKQEADTANIPEEAPAIDPSSELKRIIDEALAAPPAVPAVP